MKALGLKLCLPSSNIDSVLNRPNTIQLAATPIPANSSASSPERGTTHQLKLPEQGKQLNTERVGNVFKSTISVAIPTRVLDWVIVCGVVAEGWVVAGKRHCLPDHCRSSCHGQAPSSSGSSPVPNTAACHPEILFLSNLADVGSAAASSVANSSGIAAGCCSKVNAVCRKRLMQETPPAQEDSSPVEEVQSRIAWQRSPDSGNDPATSEVTPWFLDRLRGRPCKAGCGCETRLQLFRTMEEAHLQRIVAHVDLDAFYVQVSSSFPVSLQSIPGPTEAPGCGFCCTACSA